jgi:hypothetical protein
MNSKKLFSTAFSTTLLSSLLLCGTVYGADSPVATPTTTPAPIKAELSPELQAAAERIDLSKSKLDQARQQLSAAKAMLKAAEAEFRAARADQEALSLRTEARKLADASGLQDGASKGNRLYPVDLSQIKSTAPGIAEAAAPGSVPMSMGTDNRIHPVDFIGQPNAGTPGVSAPAQPNGGLQ